MIAGSTRGQQTYFWSTENADEYFTILAANPLIMHFPTHYIIWQQALGFWTNNGQSRSWEKKKIREAALQATPRTRDMV